MTRSASMRAKIPTDSPQPLRTGAARGSARPRAAGSPIRSSLISASAGRTATRGGGEVIELECGITVYPARSEGGRWRAVWYEAGERQQCEASSEEKLGPKLAKVAERLRADAPSMRKPGAALIVHYLDPDRLPVRDRWSRRHADTQRRLCERFALPVIGAVTCQDIKTEHMQKVVNAAPTAGEGGARLAELLECGLLQGSYIPPPELKEVRDLTRLRTKKVQARTSDIQRLGKTLESAGIKLGSVASDITGKGPTAMIEALIDGERRGAVMADLAIGRARAKMADLSMALEGRFTDHHAMMCRLHLDAIALHDAGIADLEARIAARAAP